MLLSPDEKDDRFSTLKNQIQTKNSQYQTPTLTSFFLLKFWFLVLFSPKSGIWKIITLNFLNRLLTLTNLTQIAFPLDWPRTKYEWLNTKIAACFNLLQTKIFSLNGWSNIQSGFFGQLWEVLISEIDSLILY